MDTKMEEFKAKSMLQYIGIGSFFVFQKEKKRPSLNYIYFIQETTSKLQNKNLS